MSLSHYTNSFLHLDTKKLVAGERQQVTLVLKNLIEIDKRKLYSDYKRTSLFDYCVGELGYSESAAQRRIVASRLLSQAPEIEQKIQQGLLSLSNISQVNHFFKDAELKDKLEALKEIENLSSKECEKKLFEITGKQKIIREKKERISSTETSLTIILSNETLLLIDEVKSLLHKELSTDELIKLLAQNTIAKLQKEKFKVSEKPRKSLPPAEVGRGIRASVKREVFLRDKKCTNCGSTHRLNYDHRVPHSMGGANDAENIRLLCFQCNQRARIRMNLNHPGQDIGPKSPGKNQKNETS